ncbi:Gfo/Idh/MocA family protein [Longibaculum muris]|uniref:Gfo/Idh/MocA family protein n=1 Tax=Longibaculum muris TaxID=1796628 RepID=UPI0022E70435|nr:Gfo/Idh/MocA family oxidoreductase [Longibaculum muris]
MKLGILGTGMIVRDLLTTIHEMNIESIYILGTKQTEEETKQLVKQYHLNGYELDYESLLSKDIDTVYVALPNHLHYIFAKKALEQGKHVIIEKPITANLKELKDLIKLAKEKHLMMIEAMNVHYLPAFHTLKEYLKKIGQPKIVSFNYSQYSSRYDAFKAGHILPAFDYHKAGGALMDLNVYNIHGIVGLFGKPQKIQYLANIENQIDTSGILTLDYGHFKAVSIGAKDCKAPVMLTLQGDQGVIRMDKPINQLITFEYMNNQNEIITINQDEGKHRLFYEFEKFIHMIDNYDENAVNEMLEISLIVSEIMQEARLQEGIVFDNDR